MKRVERRAEGRGHTCDAPIDLTGWHQCRQTLPQSLYRVIAGQAVQLHGAAVGDVALQHRTAPAVRPLGDPAAQRIEACQGELLSIRLH